MNQAPTMRALVGEIHRELTQVDSRIWQTMRALISPGVLAQRWTRGQYAGLLPPFRLYLIASTLFFLAGGGVTVSEGVSRTVLEMIPDHRLVDLEADAVRAAIQVRMLSWVALIRMATLIPLALLVALMIPRGQARMAPAFVFAMNYFTVAFALAAGVVLLNWLVHGLPIEIDGEWVAGLGMLAERFLLLTWLALGLRRFLERGWLFSVLSALLLLLVDLALLLMAFGMGMVLMAHAVRGLSG